jgi:hypothetical protein
VNGPDPGQGAQRPGELPARQPPRARRAGRARRDAWRPRLTALTGAPELFPGLAALAVFFYWAGSQGGIAATDSYPGALFLLGLALAVGVAFRGHLLRLPRLPLIALALLAAFVVWNFLSIGWADDQGTAWDGANRCLLYLTVFCVFVIPPWRPRAAAAVLGLYALGIGVIGVVVLLKAAGSADPLLHYFVAGRFAQPTGYQNANAALFTGAMFVGIFIASRRETPWPLRGVALALAGILFHLALMPQSRGWSIAAPIALLAYLVLVPGLTRSLITLLPLGAVLALTASPVLHVFEVSDDASAIGPALDDARTSIFVAAAVLFVIGAVIGLIDSRLQIPERTGRIGNRVVLGLAGVVAVAGVIAGLAVIGNPVSWAGDRWSDFKGGHFEYQTGGSARFGQSLGSNRYDFWRVAADEFTSAPIAGVGSDNFAEDYVRDRKSGEEPKYPHNVPLGVLAETGLIGGLLLAGFLVASLTAVGRVRLRGRDDLARGVAGISAVVFAYWFVHSTGDWFWAFPALTAPVFAWLGMGARLEADPVPDPEPRWARRTRPALIAATVVVSLFAAVSLALPWTSALDVEKAIGIWRTDPAEAFDRLDQARKLNFLSAGPDLVQGEIASQLGEHRRMRSSFDRALERDPRNWYATLELATLDGVEGRRDQALARLDRVSELNPREPLTATLRNGIVKGKPLTLADVDHEFLVRYCRVLGLSATASGDCA